MNTIIRIWSNYKLRIAAIAVSALPLLMIFWLILLNERMVQDYTLNENLAELEYNVVTSHALLERHLSGDEGIDISDLTTGINRSIATLEMILSGGLSKHDIPIKPLEDEVLIHQTEEAIRLLGELLSLTLERYYEETDRPGYVDANNRYDAVYGSIFVTTETLKKSFEADTIIVHDQAHFLSRGLLVIWTTVIVILMAGFISWDKERKKTLRQLRESEERYRSLIELSADAVIVHSDGIIKYINPKGAEILGATDYREIVGTPILDLIPPEARKEVQRGIDTVLKEGTVTSPQEQVYLKVDGDPIDVEVSGAPIMFDGKASRLVNIRDITERKEAEEKLAKSEYRHRVILSTTTDYFYSIQVHDDGNLEVDWVGGAFEKLTGYEPDIVKDVEKWMSVIHEDDLDGFLNQMNIALTNKKSTFEYRITRKDGEIRWLSDISLPIWDDEKGRVGVIYGAVQDITDRKAERETRLEIERKLERAKRMESLGILAGGVAHDLNNIIGPIMAYPDIILSDLPEDTPVKEDLVQLKIAARRAADVIADLLTLARRGKYEMKPLNLNEIVKSYLESPGFKEKKAYFANVEHTVSYNDDLLNIAGSEPHLLKVVMNLINNAIESMEPGGVLTIETDNRYIDRRKLAFDEITEGEYAVLSIEDRGVGIKEEDLNSIFEPFYTTKDKSGKSGTGLGLSIVYNVVKDHKGFIDVESEFGKGTMFVIYFPVCREGISGSVTSTADNRGEEKILVVDDVEQQRILAERLLSSLGYKVESVENGHEALEYLKEKEADLVVLDMIMEVGFDGLDTYKGIIEINPNQKTIIASGFSETARVKEARKLGAGAYIRKPYTLNNFGKAIRKELDS